jgi:hypothetical protein
MTFKIDGANGLTFPNLSTQASAGQVLQVVQATNSTQIAINSSSLVTTNISASIIPKFSTSKVLVRFLVSVYSGGSNRGTALAIYRGATRIWYPGGTNDAGGYGSYYNYGGDGAAVIPIEFLDSPATTSSTTYTIYACSFNGSSVTFNINNTVQNNQSSAILMEVAS